MVEIQAVHECLFCPQTFDSAVAKDDHVLEHFAQESCVECNQNLIRIGGSLYVKHDTFTCVKRALKIEDPVESTSIDLSNAQNHTQRISKNRIYADGLEEENEFSFERIKIEQEDAIEFASGSNENDSLLVESNDFEQDHSTSSSIFASEDKSTYSNKKSDASEMIFQIEHSIEKNTKQNDRKQFKCETCGKVFGKKTTLSRHNIMLHSSPDTTIFCNICCHIFTTIADRDVHRIECVRQHKMRLNKKSRPDLRCDLCNKPYKTDRSYRDHMKRTHKQSVTRFKCERCHEFFLKQSWLNEHQCSAKFSCEMCGQNFANTQLMQRHQTRSHSSTDIICKICKKKFDNHIERDLHRAACSDAEQRPRRTKGSGEIQCDLCSTKFQTNINLQKHMRMKHDSSIEKFRCTMCRAVFLKESSLQSHICPKSHAYPCDICNKQLGSSHSLRIHKVRFHSAPGTIYCDVCGKHFTVADERDRHQLECKLRKKMDSLRLIGRFECECKKVYRTKHDLRRHMRAKHDPNVHNFKCTLCGAIFLQELSLQKHICKGRQDKSSQRELIPCEACGKVITRGRLNTHRIAFHGAGTLYCSTCYKVFTNTDELDAHRQKCLLRVKTPKKCDICDKVLANPNALVRHKISLHSAPTVIFCKTCIKKFKTIEELNAHVPECTLKRKLQKMQKQNELPENNIE